MVIVLSFALEAEHDVAAVRIPASRGVRRRQGGRAADDRQSAALGGPAGRAGGAAVARDAGGGRRDRGGGGAARRGERAGRLSRATLAVVAEIAAGAAQRARVEQRRHYQAARGSANEAMSCVEVAQLHGVVPADLAAQLAAQLARVDAMLVGMVRRRNS